MSGVKKDWYRPNQVCFIPMKLDIISGIFGEVWRGMLVV